MARGKDSEAKQTKKKFSLVDYEKKYQKEREMTDRLMKKFIGKSRDEIEKSPELLEKYLKESGSGKPDDSQSKTGLGSQVVYVEVPTEGDGNCAYNAAALGIWDLILSGARPESDALRDFFSELLKETQVSDNLALLQFIANLGHAPRQKLLAKHLRTLAVDYIRQHYENIYRDSFEVKLINEYDAYKHHGILGDMFCEHNEIKAKFDECATWEKVHEWWTISGKNDYFNRIRVGGVSRSQWGSEIELDAVACLFKININVEKKENNEWLSAVVGVKYGSLDRDISEQQVKMLLAMNVCEMKSGKYNLRVKSQAELHNAIDKLDDNHCDAVRECIRKSKEIRDRDCCEPLQKYIGKLKNRGIVNKSTVSYYIFNDDAKDKLANLRPELRRKVEESIINKHDKLKSSDLSLPYTAIELSELKKAQVIRVDHREEKYLLLASEDKVDEAEIESRLNGLPDLFETLLKCLMPAIPEFNVRNQGIHWVYLRKKELRVEVNPPKIINSTGALDRVNHKAAEVSKILTQDQVQEFLDNVVRGNIRALAVQLDQNPDLVHAAGTVNTLSKQSMPDITGFQYSVWSRLKEVQLLILKHLATNYARDQKDAFENERPDLTADDKFGKHVDLNRLITKLKVCLDDHDCRSDHDLLKYWFKEISPTHRLLPVWVMYYWKSFGNKVGHKIDDISLANLASDDLLMWYSPGSFGWDPGVYISIQDDDNPWKRLTYKIAWVSARYRDIVILEQLSRYAEQCYVELTTLLSSTSVTPTTSYTEAGSKNAVSGSVGVASQGEQPDISKNSVVSAIDKARGLWKENRILQALIQYELALNDGALWLVQSDFRDIIERIESHAILILSIKKLEDADKIIEYIEKLQMDYHRSVVGQEIVIVLVNKDIDQLDKHIRLICPKVQIDKDWGKLGIIPIASVLNCSTLILLLNEIFWKKNNIDIIYALVIAAEYTRVEVLDALQSQKFDFNCVDNEGNNAIYYALCSEYSNAVKLLKERGVKSAFSEKSIKRLVRKSVMSDNFDVICQLLKFPDEVDPAELESMIEQSVKMDLRKTLSLFKHLVYYGMAHYKFTRVIERSFIDAIFRHDSNAVCFLLSKGMKPSSEYEDGKSPFIVACTQGDEPIFRALVDAGADVNLEVNGLLPLAVAVKCQDSYLVKYLLAEAKAKVELIKPDALNIDQKIFLAKIQQEVEDDRNFRISAAVLGKAQSSSLMAAGQKAVGSAGEDVKKTDKSKELRL